MRSLGIATALVALVVPARSAAPLAASPSPAAGTSPAPRVGVAPSGRARVHVDPRTLHPLRRPRLALGAPLLRWSGAWAFSPDRSRLAIVTYSERRFTLRFVGVRSLRPLGAVTLAPDLELLAWIAPRLVAVVSGCCELALVDPVDRQVLRRVDLGGDVVASSRTTGSLVLVVGPSGSIGPARLVVVDGDGTRSLVLPLSAGLERASGDPERSRVQIHVPGLAVDGEARRAFVVDPAGFVADVDLSTLTVSRHQLSDHKSLLGRWLDWLEPAATPKGGAPEGPWRYAEWLGNGFIAVAGTDHRAEVGVDGSLDGWPEPAGLDFVDTSSWEMRTVHTRATGFVAAGGVVIVAGSTWDPATKTARPLGLTVFDPDGTKRFERFPGRDVAIELVYDGRAYVEVGEHAPLRVVDLATGRVLGRRARIPTLLFDSMATG